MHDAGCVSVVLVRIKKMERTYSRWQTIFAAITSIAIYLIMIYIVTPMLDKILIVFGKILIPERFGGGIEADNPGLLTTIIRGMFMNWLSAYAAFRTCSALFANAHVRTVAVIFGLVVLTGVGLFTYAFFHSDGFGALIIPIVALPAIYLVYVAWRDKEL
jgi:hypothetical protein